jgi:hypothetical protein
MNPFSIGGRTLPLQLAIKQGASGVCRISIPATKASGDPLDSYEGWTAKLSLYRTQGGAAEISLEPTVTGDADGKRFVVDVEFAGDATAAKAPGVLFGDLSLVAPSGDRRFPFNVTLSIDRSYSGAAP